MCNSIVESTGIDFNCHYFALIVQRVLQTFGHIHEAKFSSAISNFLTSETLWATPQTQTLGQIIIV